MQEEHQWLPFFIQILEARLVSQRIGDVRQTKQCPNLYSLVGFGRRSIVGQVFRDNRGRDFVTAREFLPLARRLSADRMGYREDGYQAIVHGLQETTWRNARNGPVAQLVVLVTDEDRDEIDKSITRLTISNELRQRGIQLHAILDQQFTAGGVPALGVDASNNGYLGGQLGDFSVTTNQIKVGDGFADTTHDYTLLALELGGSAWDINVISNTLRLQALTEAFVSALAKSINRVRA